MENQITVKEFTEKVNDAVKYLEGKNPKVIKGGVSKLVEEALFFLLETNYAEYHFTVNNCMISMSIGSYEKEEIGHIITRYKEDKRMKNESHGNIIKEACIEMAGNFSPDMMISKVYYKLLFETNRKRRSIQLNSIRELEVEIADKKKTIEEAETVMSLLEELQ